MPALRRLLPVAAALALVACAGDNPDVVIGADSGVPPADGAADVSAPDDVPAPTDVPAPQDLPTPRDVVDVPAPLDVTDVPAPSDVSAPLDAPDAPAPADITDAADVTDAPGRCASDRDCAGDTPACDVAAGRCVACVNDGHCGPGRLCVGSLCVAGCTTMHPCPAGQSCCTGACVETASSLVHCGACGTVCRAANATPACLNGVCGVGMCATGFGDCNGRGDDGCEADLQRDTAHCGACGTTCPTPANATAATCAAGRCGFTCAAGFADCDNDAANGCEVDLRSSAAHCGLCGNACPTRPNASGAVCAAGRCDVACATGFGNCDADPENGCERSVLDSPAHCGRCGNACPVRANSTPTCAAGACGIACNAGFGDCDGDPANGCEVDTRSAPAHCGMCGRACAVANGTAGCASGACTVAACNAGRGDCDGNPSNGCEVDLARDPNNCGACGMRRTEVCDGSDNDCDGAVDEGCPTGLGGLGTFDFQSPAWGGGGGSAYDLQCPSGQFVTGFFGRSGGRVDGLGAICGVPSVFEDRSTNPFRYRVNFANAGTVGPVGGGGGDAFRYDCPAHSVVMRVQGRSGSRLDQLRVECYRWDIEFSTGAWRIVRSPTTGGSNFQGGGGGGPFDYTCPNSSGGVPSAARRFYGRAGSEVDQFGLWCTWPVLQLR